MGLTISKVTIKLNSGYNERCWSEHYDNKLFRAIIKAAKEVSGGMEIRDLKAKINHKQLKNETLDLLDLIYDLNEEEIVESLTKRSFLP